MKISTKDNKRIWLVFFLHRDRGKRETRFSRRPIKNLCQILLYDNFWAFSASSRIEINSELSSCIFSLLSSNLGHVARQSIYCCYAIFYIIAFEFDFSTISGDTDKLIQYILRNSRYNILSR